MNSRRCADPCGSVRPVAGAALPAPRRPWSPVWVLALALAGLSFPAPAARADEAWTLQAALRETKGRPELLVGGKCRAEDGAHVRITLELDGAPVRAAQQRAEVKQNRFAVVLPLFPGKVLPGEYLVRAVVEDGARKETSALVRVGSLDEELSVRVEFSEWMQGCTRDLLGLARELARRAPGPEGEAAAGPWRERFEALQAKLRGVLQPGAYFALYHAADAAELASWAAGVERVEEERESESASPEGARAPARTDLVAITTRLAGALGEVSEERQAAARLMRVDAPASGERLPALLARLEGARGALGAGNGREALAAAEAVLADLEADRAVRGGAPEFVVRAQAAAECIRQLADLARPAGGAAPDVRPAGWRAYYERTLEVSLARLRALVGGR